MARALTLSVSCGTCPARGQHCDDCVVTALEAMGPPVTSTVAAEQDEDAWASTDLPVELPLDAVERRAVDIFVAAGLVSPATAVQVRARATVPFGHQVGERAAG